MWEGAYKQEERAGLSTKQRRSMRRCQAGSRLLRNNGRSKPRSLHSTRGNVGTLGGWHHYASGQQKP
eukprot:5863468-Pyramimonas_sp.AAC.1